MSPLRAAFTACDSALDRCRSPEDCAYVSGIVQQLKRDTVLYGVHDRMQRASERMAGLRGAR